MTAGVHVSPSIESVDAFARQLYRRARSAGADFDDLTTALRSLERALQHLLCEAHDPDSLIHQPSPTGDPRQHAPYAKQLASLVKDSDSTLNEVGSILDRYESDQNARGARAGIVNLLDPVEKARKIKLIEGSVVSQRIRIDIFLDTLQLHNHTKTHLVLERADDQQLDMIGKKVDAIANRLFRERARGSPVDGAEDELWHDFKTELEREGFSSEVLWENRVSCIPSSPSSIQY